MRILRALLIVVLLVLPASKDVQAQGRAYAETLLVSLTIDRERAFEKEQILLTVKVGIPFNAFNLTQSVFEISDAEVISLHKKEFIDTHDDTPYQFEQTVFAIFANKAGELTIPPIRFRATLPVASGGANNKSNPEITAITQPRQIRIDTALESGDRWLAASNVQITANWAGSADNAIPVKLRTGEPSTRHIHVTVQGQHPAAIPPITLPSDNSSRSYLDLPKLEVTPSELGLTGKLTQSIALVASKPGSITLPEVAIKWWHIDDREWKVTKLAAEKLEIIPGMTQTENPDQQTDPSSSAYRNIAVMLAVVSLLLTTIIAALCLKLKSTSSISSRNLPDSPAQTEAQTWSRLQRSIASAELAKIRESVLLWQNSFRQTPAVTRLDQIGANNQLLRQQLTQIDRLLYRPTPLKVDQTNDGIDLKLLRKALRLERKAQKDSIAEQQSSTGLYPIDL